MKKIAVVVSGWHFPLHFYEEIAKQKVPNGWEVDLFCVSHRDPKFSIEEKQKYLSQLGWGYEDVLDKIFYEKFASVEDIEKLGWKYMLVPNTVGDWGNTNQWLDEYDYKKYDILLVSHDDNIILNRDLFVDVAAREDDWLVITNSTGSRGWKDLLKAMLGRPLNVRGSFEFFKKEVLDMMGGKFDLTGTTLSREGETYSGDSMKALNNWNMTVVPMKLFFQKKGLAKKMKAFSNTYRVSAYCIEGERGFISSMQKADSRSYKKGLSHVQKKFSHPIEIGYE